MKCGRAQELIHPYLDGTIALPDRRALDGHLAACEECRHELRTTRALLATFADVPRRHLSDNFDRALQTQLAGLASRRSPWPAWTRFWQMNAWRIRPALVPAAAALATLLAFEIVPPQRPEAPSRPETAAYVAQCVREHESGVQWRELPEAAVEFNLQVASAATVAGDLVP